MHPTVGEPTPLWGEGARDMGAGGSPPPYSENVKGGLPTAPKFGRGGGGIAGRKAFVPPNYGGEGG